VQASVPELVNGTDFNFQRKRAGGQAKRLYDALSKTLGHGGNQVGVPQHITQGHVMRHRQAKAALQALFLECLIHPAVACACSNDSHMLCLRKGLETEAFFFRQGVPLPH